ncbi:MAG: hypothetical protein HY042_01040, partial [Spirochaetia bacterium]|nr:hypothetical protein [Spirochaetia bacterium]
LIFSHTDPVITAALAFQAMRGVLVEGIYDDAGETSSLVPGTEAHQLNNALGVLPSAVFLEGNRSRTEVKPGEFHGGHLHHKTMIIDDRLVVTGSYNWSLSARDQNREAYFEFADPAVAQLFVREFSRIKESALPAGRPPFIDRAAPRMTLQTGGVCWDNAPAQQGFTIFSGKGTFLRADHYNTQSAAVSGCVLPASKNSASAGVQWGSSYGILPAADSGELSAWQFNLTSRSPVLETEPGAGRSGSQTALWQPPCDADPCSAAPLFRTHLPDGWIWLRSESERYTEAVFWTPDGFETRALSRTATNFYRFQPFGRTVGDTIVFLKTESGRYEAGCTRTGTTLSGPPRTWLKAYAFEAGRSLSCVEDES